LHRKCAFSPTPYNLPCLSLSLSLFAEKKWLLLNESLERLHAERLWSLDGQAESTVPDELSDTAHGARDTKDDGVVLELGEAVVVEERAGSGVDVGERVLGLAVLGENAGRDLEELCVVPQITRVSLADRQTLDKGTLSNH
jgi:hypothetical protein